MKIIIVGCGNVGSAIAEQLSYEGHNITVVDVNEKLVNGVSDAYDVLGVVGNGASLNIQREAGVDNADLLIAVTGADELNLLCCLIARKAGGCHTIARVSNPVYSREIGFIKEELGLSMIINPQMAAAQEIGRLLKFPSALKVDSFAKSRVELVIYKVPEDSALCGVKLRDLTAKVKCNVLIPIVERGEEVMIPDGEFELAAGDEITIVSPAENTIDFFKKMGDPTSVTRDIMMIGGGTTTIYLARQLLNMGVKVKIVEQDPARCEELTEMLPKALVICGDATDKELLIEEGLKTVGAFASMTNFDEENIMLTLFAKSLSKAKLFTKVHRISYDEIIESLGVGSVIYPKYITAEEIIKYVRAMKNSIGSNIETLYRLNDNRVEALEFQIREDSPVVGIPLKELNLKKNMIIGCITHKGKVEMPTGNSVIKVNDMVILITTTTGLHDIRDALR
ncbi:MAG TPA: Trk system potassium transporter TrkA [Lachnospiraceae bacterium]|mgnify:FL=1|jgi:trk system potassium uptake protein TrkA|nr:Trk system potassium transporter TrkA [Lachnospiraceae bacterium]